MSKSSILLWFNIASGVASIIGVVLVLLACQWCGFIALAFVVLFLTSILVMCYYTCKKMIETSSPTPYKKLSVFSMYETSDGVHGVYESFRTIQSKRIILRDIDWHFKWSGSKKPIISSDLQKIGGSVIDGGDEYDKIKLVLKQPLFYNDTATIHFKAEVDDIDGKAEPYYAYRVDSPVNLVHFHIILKDKPDNYNRVARVQRRLISSPLTSKFVDICSVPFDQKTKSYQYNLLNPEIDYFYQIFWG